MYVLGFDIGGTKCAVISAEIDGDRVTFLGKEKIATDLSVSPTEMIFRLCALADGLTGGRKPAAIGVSCGGPLDSKHGIILSPPNLTGWDEVRIKDVLEERYKVKVNLQNDANACAVAEWKWGAGKGCRNMIFLTFGTGLGAGLILDGRLYTGTNDMAGETGHLRLEDDGPVGYGKAGSFEGFCSGGGIARLGYAAALEKIAEGKLPAYFREGMGPSDVTAKTVADAAESGDETALEVYRSCGEHLGRGLALLIDLLNPEKIVIGSIFARSRDLLWEPCKKVLEKEALPLSLGVCEVVPASLGDEIGDYAAVSTALL
ncbi:MAG: ROK family protein [Clostridia bacterium]|nr:ROK family protein [Clostridia bacterium]